MTELRLLLIEDTEDDAELVVVALHRAGFDCRVTLGEATAAGVRRALAEQPFDVVLCDYRMPGFNGADALAIVRAHDSRLPFLIVSGTIGEEAAVDVVRAGANDYVMKGNLSRLGAAVRRELQQVVLERERAALELQLARARENLTRSVEMAPVGICHNAPGGLFTMVNPAFCEILGYSADELCAMSFEDITHPEDLAGSHAARNAMHSGEVDQVRFEKRYRRKDGSDVWVNLSSSAIRDAEGRVDYFFTVISDTTARRAAQEELRRRARQQEAIALFGQMVVSGCALEMLYEEMTERLTAVLDVDICDVFKTDGDTLRLVAAHGWPDGSIGSVGVSLLEESHIATAMEGGLPVSIQFPPDDGTTPGLPLHPALGMRSGLIVPVGGGIVGAFAAIGAYSRQPKRFAREDEDFLTACGTLMAQAIERRRIEEAKGRLADELSLLLDSVAEGIFRFDLDGRCTMINRAAAAILGEHAPIESFSVQTIERPDTGVRGILESISAGSSLQVDGAVFCTSGGQRVPVDFSASPLVENGVVVGGVVCFSDISVRRQLETQLERERRLNGLGRLAASMAHEFNNVLMAISPFAELLARAAAPTDKSTVTATEQIRRGVRRGKRITEEILRFANPTPPTLSTFAAGPWLGSVAEDVRPLLGPKVQLAFDTDPKLQVVADAPQLSQVAQNLIMNARDAMPKGGVITVSLRLATATDRARFELLGDADYVHLSVADTGTGIPREQLDQIFEPLFTTKRSGTGLGLPISRQIIRKHDGHLLVESAPESGTVFHIFIPVMQVLGVREANAVVDSDVVAGMTVLLVEDDPHVATGLRLALEDRGVIVHHVATGNGALRALADFSVDAAIIDVGLPDMDGTRVFEQGAQERRIPVVFSTGHADQSKVAPYLTHSHVAHLLKPYSIDVLLQRVVDVTGAADSTLDPTDR